MSGASPAVSPGPDVSVAVASDPRVSAAHVAAGLVSPLTASCRSCPMSASGIGHWVPSFVGIAAAPPAAGRSWEGRCAIRSRTRSSSRPAPGGTALASAPELESPRNSARRSAIRPRSLPPRGVGSAGCPGAGDSLQLTPSGSVHASPGSGAAAGDSRGLSIGSDASAAAAGAGSCSACNRVTSARSEGDSAGTTASSPTSWGTTGVGSKGPAVAIGCGVAGCSTRTSSRTEVGSACAMIAVPMGAGASARASRSGSGVGGGGVGVGSVGLGLDASRTAAAGRFSSTAVGGRSASTGTSSMATLTASLLVLSLAPSLASSIWKIDSGGGSQAAGPVTASANDRPDTNAAATM